MSVRIMLADDHPIVRGGVRGLIEGETAFQVVAEVGDGGDVIPMVKQTKPDIVILDLGMPGLGGIEIARRIQGLDRAPRVIILSRHTNETYVLAALDAGASGYINKDSVPQELIKAVNAALSGERFLSPSISDQRVEAFRERLRNGGGHPLRILPPREREVLHLVTEGCTNRQISAALGVSVRTVEAHRANLMKKLKVESTAELIRLALEEGVLPE